MHLRRLSKPGNSSEMQLTAPRPSKEIVCRREDYRETYLIVYITRSLLLPRGVCQSSQELL
jgi:hypothetical protein